jgi:two-component system chemotaxis response regulator CheB
MSGRDIIVVGASAGGVEALTALVAGLPPDLPAAVFVVLHLPAEGRSMLPGILARVGPLPADHPREEEPLVHGRIYVAPPDHHLIVQRGTVRLARGPRENLHRPSIDVLFRTAARAYGPRVVGVVLSGTLDDGTAGLLSIKSRGGVAIVQDPDEALFAAMPASARDHVDVDYCLPVAQMGQVLATFAREPVGEERAPAASQEMEMESDMAELQVSALHDDDRPGRVSGFSCPECHGVLWEVQDGELLRFRCRVGHALSVDTLLAEQSEELEAALWAALRALEEQAALTRRLADRGRERGRTALVARFEERAEQAQSRATLIRQALLNEAAGARESA